MQQGDRVPAAGQGQDDGARIIGAQAGRQPGDGLSGPVRVGPVQPGRRAGGRAAGARAGAQVKRVPSSVARARWAAVAVAA